MTHQPPLRAFYSKRGSGVQRKASAETGRMEPREWAEGTASQWAGRDQSVLCAERFESGPNKGGNGACNSICLQNLCRSEIHPLCFSKH